MTTKTKAAKQAVPAAALPAAPIFGEEAGRIVAQQALQHIGRSLTHLWADAYEGDADGLGWGYADADALIVLKITIEEHERIEAAAKDGADAIRLAGGISRLAALLAGVNTLRTEQDEYSTPILQDMAQELTGFTKLIEHVVAEEQADDSTQPVEQEQGGA